EAALRAADIYSNQLRNQVEAIKAFELVRSIEPNNPVAVDFLVKAYEQRREFEKLLALRRQEADELPAGPARAAKFAELARLETDPNDKQAQEAVKKKYLALQRWDDLEQFYAESGKWDEFIRVLEQQEAKETENAAKAGLLFKIAQLWNDRKQKTDRAAKAYERVLE